MVLIPCKKKVISGQDAFGGGVKCALTIDY